MANKIKYDFPDFKGYVKNFNKVIERFYVTFEHLWRDSTAEFLRTVVNSILIDTGMSGGSLLPLAKATASGAITSSTKQLPSEIKTELFALRKINSRKGVVVIDGSYRPDLTRNIRQGQRFGKAFKLDFGSPRDPMMEMFFQINVFQFQFHEDGGKMRRALDAGLKSFVDYYNSNLSSYFPTSEVSRTLNAFKTVRATGTGEPLFRRGI